MKATLAALLLLPPTLLATGAAAETVDLDLVNRIRDEAFERSQVMEIARHLTDETGPRLTGSPALRTANEWTLAKFEEWGLERARLEPFEFGEGWSFERAQMRMLTPTVVPLAALPLAWSPGTEGAVRGEALRVTLASEKDFEEQAGKLAGKILLLDEARDPDQDEAGTHPERWDDESLAELVEFDIPSGRPSTWRERALKRSQLSEKLAKFMVDEGAVATVTISSRQHGVLRLGGNSSNRDPERPRGVPAVAMAVEHYQRILRLLEAEKKVELEIEVTARFHPEETRAFNTIAEIPGTDRAAELVLVGAHLDSWHAGTGATDNAAGSAVVMETARILKALGVRPRRTIRFALWAGEEQGLLGARAYVEEHVADRPETTDPEQLELPKRFRETTWPIRTKPEHAKISAYYNLDNGGGRIRGIYTQGNVAAAPLFASWLVPLTDLGAATVTNESTSSTDHTAFDSVGVPGFQFVQDPLDYRLRTHHTHLDTFERLHREDLIASSVVLTTFVLQTANRDGLLPRKPMPQKPPEKPKAAPSEPADE